MSTTESVQSVDVRGLLFDADPFGPAEAAAVRNAVGGASAGLVRQMAGELKQKVDSSDSSQRSRVALGVALYFLARHHEADAYLEAAAGNGTAEYHHGHVLVALERYQDAAAKYAAAAKHGWDSVSATLAQAGAARRTGNLEEAEALIRSTGREGATRAEYSYQMGCIFADRGDTYVAIEYFERAVDMDPHHSGALFRLAALQALFGNDEDAIKLYERSLSKPPLFIGALVNLGLLYEDIEQYNAAAFCFRRVLEQDPRHERSRLYLKDIEAAGDMYYDEDAARRSRELEQVLNVPITDFELSARSRNCLERAGISTLGDLARITEDDLLAGKNFGDTSLREIREMLASRGLRIGQMLSQDTLPVATYKRDELTPEERATFEKPVTDLNLSVRARKCLTRLGISTLGELMSRSADELLAVRNFGVTSLNEIRAKLGDIGLALRND